MKKIYFIGIGGIGMSALARYFFSQKIPISGSDVVQSPITRSLQKEGLEVKIGHKKAHIDPGVGLVIYNRAISANNPELLEARRLMIPAIPYARVLGEITKNRTTIAITGSHGKTTTTALAGIMLLKNDFDPTIFVGSNLKELHDKNIRIGKSPYLVLEADDFGGAFLEYAHAIAIVTNIDREHLDFYKSFANLQRSFLRFLSHVTIGGTLILNRDDKNLYSLHNKINVIAKKRRARVMWYSSKDRGTSKVKGMLTISGAHNLSNAMAVYTLGKLLKISERNIVRSLGLYHGAWRRMEYRWAMRVGKKTIEVFDDYAHHPTEIKATLAAFREKFRKPFLICVFEPHQAQRLTLLFRDFRDAFHDADATIILPLYHVKGRDSKRRRTASDLFRAMQKKFPGKPIFYAKHLKAIKDVLTKIVGSCDTTRPLVLVMMGAGSIVNLTDQLVA